MSCIKIDLFKHSFSRRLVMGAGLLGRLGAGPAHLRCRRLVTWYILMTSLLKVGIS